MPPAVESDENDNVYVIANYYPQKGETPYLKLYKLAPPNYTVPPGVVIANRSSGKWSTVLDQTRHWIWICLWEDSTAANLFAVDYNGVIQVQKNIFNAYSGPGWIGPELYAG